MTRLKTSLKIVTIIIAFDLMLGCTAMPPKETREWEPTPVTDFKSAAGKWEGLLIRTPRTPDDDWVTLVIDGTGAYEFASYRTIGVFAGKGRLSLTDGKLGAKSEKGGQMTLQLHTDRGSGARMLKLDAKDSGGFTYSAELRRTGDPTTAK